MVIVRKGYCMQNSVVSSYGAFKALATPKSITTLNHIHKVNVVLSYRKLVSRNNTST